jgi:hypothetical protein
MNAEQKPCLVGGPSRACGNSLRPQYTTNYQTPEEILGSMIEIAQRRPHDSRDDCIRIQLLDLLERWKARQ